MSHCEIADYVYLECNVKPVPALPSAELAKGCSWTSRVQAQAPGAWGFAAEYTQRVISGRLESAVGSCAEVCGQLAA